MDRLSNNDLRQLVEFAVSPENSSDNSKPCVSIFCPMYKSGREVQQNPIRYKNGLKTAREQLEEYGCHEDTIEQLLSPAEDLLKDQDFWQHQSNGLAVFIGAGFFEMFRLPTEFDEQVVVGKRFHVKPLTTLITEENQWYVLAASPNRVRLLHANMYGVDDLEPENFPEDLREALNIDEYVSSMQLHSTSREMSGATQQDAIHHGHGGSDPDVKKQDEILQYFHRLDDAITDYLGNSQHPLVFAGVNYLFPIFKEACKYPNVVDEPVTGNPDDLTPEQLQEKSREIMVPRFKERAEASVAAYKEKAHTDWADFDPLAIYHAAKIGQVDTLIISPDAESWVEFGQNGEINAVEENSANAEDLVNCMVVETLSNGGKVVSSVVDTNSRIAATFRSPANQYLDQVIRD